MIALTILVAVLLIAGGLFVMVHYGPIVGGYFLGGWNTMTTGLEILIKAIAEALND